jgi:hypothetical protein
MIWWLIVDMNEPIPNLHEYIPSTSHLCVNEHSGVQYVCPKGHGLRQIVGHNMDMVQAPHKNGLLLRIGMPCDMNFFFMKHWC